MSRVLVTGCGVVSPLGNTVDEFWQALVSGQSGIRRLTRVDPELLKRLPAQIGGEVHGLDEPTFELPDTVSWKRMDRATRFALTASHQAIQHAGLTREDLQSAAVIVGAGLSGMDTLQAQTERMLDRGPSRVSPFTIPLLMPNAAPANISLAFGTQGPSWAVSTACASAGTAITEAAEAIASGRSDRVIVGGTESSLTPLGISAFCRMGAMCRSKNDDPRGAMRPFDATRDGMVMSEGAGMLVLESERSVAARKVKPLSVLVGWGASSDAHHLVAPHPEGSGLVKAIQATLDRANFPPYAVASRVWVNAHGTSTRMNDITETLAFKQVFGEEASNLQISSTKSMTGHPIGACAALESVAGIKALETGLLPPTINLHSSDPECDLDYIANTTRECDVDLMLNSICGFGGHNVALLFARLT